MAFDPIRLERFHTVALPRAEVWRLLAETDHLNRVIGLFPVVFSPVKRHAYGPYRLASAKVANLIPIVWREYPFQWVVEQEHVVERIYESGPLQRFLAGIELSDADAVLDGGRVGTTSAGAGPMMVGTTIRFYAEVTPRNLLGYLATHLVGSNSMRNSIAYLDKHLAEKAATAVTVPETSSTPAASSTLRFASTQTNTYTSASNATRAKASARPQTSNKPTVNVAELNRLLQLLAEAPVQRDYIPILHDLITNHDDDEVVTVRPYELARYHDANGREMLRLFLYATKIGIFNLSWNMMCPNCRVSKFQTKSLADVGQSFHCDFCGIQYETNFDNYVELRFSVHPNIRVASEAIYCIGGPAITPHILVQRCVAGGESTVIRYPDTMNTLRIRSLQSNYIVAMEVSVPQGTPNTVGDVNGAENSITVGESNAVGNSVAVGDLNAVMNLAASSGSNACAAQRQKQRHGLTYTSEGWSEEALTGLTAGDDICITNGSNETIVVVLERVQWSEDAVTAAEVTAMQEFRDLFSSEVLAPGQQVGVENVTIFFSDLRNSTAMYENIGDAMAYGHVRKHFDFLSDWIAKNSGSLVKTIGDAVMAVFHRPQQAVEAALQIQKHAAEFSERVGEPIEIKIGIHTGPAIAVNSNDRLDYFGRTVNIAARVQGCSVGGDIVLTEDTCSYAEVRALIEAGNPTVSHFRATLKGINEDYNLVRIEVPVGGASAVPDVVQSEVARSAGLRSEVARFEVPAANVPCEVAAADGTVADGPADRPIVDLKYSETTASESAATRE